MTMNSFRQELRGDYWVLYNYIKAEKQFQVFFPQCLSTHTLYIMVLIAQNFSAMSLLPTQHMEAMSFWIIWSPCSRGTLV